MRIKANVYLRGFRATADDAAKNYKKDFFKPFDPEIAKEFTAKRSIIQDILADKAVAIPNDIDSDKSPITILSTGSLTTPELALAALTELENRGLLRDDRTIELNKWKKSAQYQTIMQEAVAAGCTRFREPCAVIKVTAYCREEEEKGVFNTFPKSILDAIDIYREVPVEVAPIYEVARNCRGYLTSLKREIEKAHSRRFKDWLKDAEDSFLRTMTVLDGMELETKLANQFRSNLYTLASDSAKAMEVNTMAEVNAKFQAIADDLVSRNMSETLTLVFPGVGTGTRIRFTLDEVNGATVDDSQVYIEGTFSLKTRSLTNIVYHGMTCTAGDSVAASSVDGVFVTLVFKGIQLDSEERIEKNHIQEWYWVEDQQAWEASTEFSAGRLPDVESTYSSALVMLLLDCSSVLDENFGELQSAANQFIERMQNYNTIPGRFTVNGVSFQMVAIDGGTFTMGSDSTMVEEGIAGIDELPAHEVTLSPYSIGQTEVTQELWTAVMGTNPSGFTGDPNRPVEQVSWDDCQEFIARLNAITGKNFRLPTEAEWEYAARGAVKAHGYTFAGGDNIADLAWYYNNSYAVGVDNPAYGTHAVGSMQANEMGLYDMSGNVYEWCADWYGAYTEDAQTNPVGPETGLRRVTRGGGWFSTDRDCRVSARNYEAPGSRNYSLGFRLAL